MYTLKNAHMLCAEISDDPDCHSKMASRRFSALTKGSVSVSLARNLEASRAASAGTLPSSATSHAETSAPEVYAKRGSLQDRRHSDGG